jgi:hypothetical protein
MFSDNPITFLDRLTLGSYQTLTAFFFKQSETGKPAFDKAALKNLPPALYCIPEAFSDAQTAH